MGRLTSWSQVANALIVHTAPLIVILVGSFAFIHGWLEIKISELVTFILMQRQLFDPLSKLAAMQATISQSQAALERIYDILSYHPLSQILTNQYLRPTNLEQFLLIKSHSAMTKD